VKIETIKFGKKTLLWIINLTILGIVLSSIFPIMSIVEDDAVKKDLYFNYYMMKNSDNAEIALFSEDVDFINIVFWIILILSLLTFFCMTFLTTYEKYYLFILMIFFIMLLIFSVLLVIFKHNLMSDIANSETISLATIIQALKYSHITVLVAFLILLCSAIFTFFIIYEFSKSLIGSKKENKTKKEKKKKKEKPEKEIKEKSIEAKPPEPIVDNRKETEDWLKDEIQKIEVKNEPKIDPENEIIDKPLQPIPLESSEPEKEDLKKYEDKNFIDDKNKQEPFLGDNEKKNSDTDKDQEPMPSFEDALSSAIQKKQNELKNNEPVKEESEGIIVDTEVIAEEEEKPEEPVAEHGMPLEESEDETGVIATEIIVKCPQCKNIFAVKKEGDSTAIKCPKCGKEGITQ